MAEKDDEKTVNLVSPAGTQVTAPAHMADALKAQGYKGKPGRPSNS